MNKVVSKTIKINCPSLPPKVSFIEKELKNLGLDPLRWAIVEVEGNNLTISVSCLSS